MLHTHYPTNQEKLTLAKNTSSCDILSELAKENDFKVMYLVASNPMTPPSVLAALSTSEYEEIRRAIAKHPSTPVEVLDTLEKHDVDFVKYGLASNPITSPEKLEEWASHEDAGVRVSVAMNPSTPLDVLSELSLDARESVQKAASVTLQIRGKTPDEDERYMGSKLAKLLAANHIPEREALDILRRMLNEA